MSAKHPISARISTEDLAYLSSIDRDGAVTTSDKLRVLFEMMREQVGDQNFIANYVTASQTISPYKARYLESGYESKVLDAVFEFVSEAAALIHSSGNQLDSELFSKELERSLNTPIKRFVQTLQMPQSTPQ